MNKIFKIKNGAFILLAMFLLSSCEYLENEPKDGLTESEYWTTETDVFSTLTGAYSTLGEAGRNLFVLGELRGDMVEFVRNSMGDEYNLSYAGIFENTYDIFKWKEYYKVINYCNLIIDKAPGTQKADPTFDIESMNNYVAEAHFLRGLTYFYLVRLYYNIPYYEKGISSDSDEEIYTKQLNGHAVLNSLLPELERQSEILDSYYGTLSESKGRATKYAMYALLADMYLWLERYDECEVKCKAIIEEGGYKLSSASNWFKKYYPGNAAESIFEIQFDGIDMKSKFYELTQVTSYSMYVHTEVWQETIEDNIHFGGNANENERDWSAVGRVGIKKYYNKKASTGYEPRSGTEQGEVNWIVYRLPEIYYMLAECYSQRENPNFDEAHELIRTYRQDKLNLLMPSKVLINEEASVYEDMIFEEKKIEYAFEGKRWFDLQRMARRNNWKRKNEAAELVISKVYTPQKSVIKFRLNDSNYWYYPIHRDEIKINDLLIQNPAFYEGN
ncbi:RagB/SusD family nutrient uptake outer membrane protein [Bacteroidales bacterium]|nr:RagB/SusD family nutrient uptake outer membrane protein [Bacteroidales bacterium]